MCQAMPPVPSVAMLTAAARPAPKPRDPYYGVGDFWNHPRRWEGINPELEAFWGNPAIDGPTEEPLHVAVAKLPTARRKLHVSGVTGATSA